MYGWTRNGIRGQYGGKQSNSVRKVKFLLIRLTEHLVEIKKKNYLFFRVFIVIYKL